MPDPTSKQATEINRPWSGPGLGSGAHPPDSRLARQLAARAPAPSLPPEGLAPPAPPPAKSDQPTGTPPPPSGEAPLRPGGRHGSPPGARAGWRGGSTPGPGVQTTPQRARAPGTRRDAAEPCLSLRRHVASRGPSKFLKKRPLLWAWSVHRDRPLFQAPTRHGRGCLTDLVKMDRVGQPTGHRTLLVTLSELVPSRDRPPPPTGHAHTPAD
ncbi:hypothetical protein N7493_009343 [Penicillium malachiteum]|uniref:Uncharacterized protein n=1 Tax=Penicillium malachiteum TaxID=1324776 RepID=A0AAD6HF02_9EURO|nr:hypothetical protein N7493_009343 [Penicillium malachiteum]